MQFSSSECIRFGWDTFKKRPWFFVGVWVLTTLISVIVSGITQRFGQGVIAFAGAVLNIAVSTFIGMGVTALYLKAHDSVESVQFADLWHPKSFWSYLVASILPGIVTVLGFVALIIPGVILALMFMFTVYLVVDKNLGPVEAMKESARLTRGHKLNLLVFVFMLIGINFLGLLCLVVGFLVTIPLSGLAMVHAYRTLSARTGAPVTV